MERDILTEPLTARDILHALAARHSSDIFIPECKNGPTATAGAHVLRMDAWAMPLSWSKPWCVAYEIKVSRSDFLRDNKWPAYLHLCNLFYFACPWKLIQPEEVAAEVGLVWITKQGSRVITKKKAPLRKDVEIPETLWRYILMARARIQDESLFKRDQRAYWKDWLRQKAEDRELGYHVSRAIRRQYDRMSSEVDRMKRLVESYEYVARRLQELGFDPKVPVGSWKFEDAEKRLTGQIRGELSVALRNLRQGLTDSSMHCAPSHESKG